MSAYTGEQGEAYFNVRKKRRSEFLQKRRAANFAPHINPSDIVLDFGCGTGGVLKHIQCAKKIGIEVNPPSIELAKAAGVEIHPDFKKIKDNSIDVIISNHALEHVSDPAVQISEMQRVLKPGGICILVVPSETPSAARFNHWQVNDPDQHIYSWTPLSFGNLISAAGLDIKTSHRRAIGYSNYIQFLAKISEPLFQIARRIVAFTLQRYEVVCIAKKRV